MLFFISLACLKVTLLFTKVTGAIASPAPQMSTSLRKSQRDFQYQDQSSLDVTAYLVRGRERLTEQTHPNGSLIHEDDNSLTYLYLQLFDNTYVAFKHTQWVVHTLIFVEI